MGEDYCDGGIFACITPQPRAKMRESGPKGPGDADEHAPGMCGVVELRTPRIAE